MTASDSPQALPHTAADWIEAFAQCLERADTPALEALLLPDAYWRDVLALTWDLHTFYGIEQIAAGVQAALPAAGLTEFELCAEPAPRLVERGGRSVTEVHFAFHRSGGRARGVVRLVSEPSGSGALRAWTIMTALDTLVDDSRPEEKEEPVAHTRDFSGPNWLDRRRTEVLYDDRQPAVLVVGAGQAGLSVAARLRQLGVDTLVVDRMDRVGDNWRRRYHALVLHNEVWANHLPYMPFPSTWPTYVPKDLLADWFEAYAEFMELNVWTSTEFVSSMFDETAGFWRVQLRGDDGSIREVTPRHIVMASGVSGIPNLPEIAGLESYRGELMHSSEYSNGARFAKKRVIVLGTGTSGHDVAQDLWSHGAEVILVQRSPSTVVSVGPDAAGRVYALYREGNATEVSDLINIATPYPVLRRSYQILTRDLAAQDRELLDGLEKVGFQLDYGEDGTGFQMKYLRRGGGYYLDVGCASLLIDGSVQLLQFADIASFAETGLTLHDGQSVIADAIVLATGYKGQTELVRRLFGDQVADRVGPIWGFDQEGELRNMWRRTGQPNLWFSAGSLAQARIFSKYLALQIKACEDGLLPAARPQIDAGGRIRKEDLEDAFIS